MKKSKNDKKQINTIGWLLGKIKKRIPALIVLAVLAAISTIISLRFTFLSKDLVDSATSGNKENFICSAVKMVLCVCIICLNRGMTIHVHDVTEVNLDRDWKKDLTHTLLNGKYSTVSSYHSGELLNRMNKDTSTISSFLLSLVPSLVSMFIQLSAALYILISMEPVFTLVLLLGGIVVVVVAGRLRKRITKLHKQLGMENGKVLGFIQEMLAGLLMVQALDVSEEMEKREERLIEQRWQIQRRLKNVSICTNTGMAFISQGVGIIAFAWAAYQILIGRISYGTLLVITQMVSRIKNPLLNLSGIMPQYFAMIASVERLRELDDVEKDETHLMDRTWLYEQMTEITSTNLMFSYKENEKIISYEDFRIAKGSFSVVVGPSGIGKSTLLKLMLGIYMPNSGELKLNDISLCRETRRVFAYVPQGNMLLSGTLRENLIISNPDAKEEEIESALYLSDLEDMIKQLPEGLNTEIGENALGISEGQAQRISIARALISGAPILLLDEATSALDEKTEQTVLRRLSELKNHTIIAVTHRPAAVELADTLIHIKS